MGNERPVKSPFGAFLKRIREREGLTRKDQAEAMGYAVSTLGNFESGITVPTTRTVAIITVLGWASESYLRQIIREQKAWKKQRQEAITNGTEA